MVVISIIFQIIIERTGEMVWADRFYIKSSSNVDGLHFTMPIQSQMDGKRFLTLNIDDHPEIALLLDTFEKVLMQ